MCSVVVPLVPEHFVAARSVVRSVCSVAVVAQFVDSVAAPPVCSQPVVAVACSVAHAGVGTSAVGRAGKIKNRVRGERCII